MPIGTLIRKIARQSRYSVSAPPTSGPTANEAPMVAPYAASAPVRGAPAGEGVREQGQRAGEQHGRPDPLHGAGGVQHGQRAGERARGRGGREHDQPEREAPGGARSRSAHEPAPRTAVASVSV